MRERKLEKSAIVPGLFKGLCLVAVAVVGCLYENKATQFLAFSQHQICPSIYSMWKVYPGMNIQLIKLKANTFYCKTFLFKKGQNTELLELFFHILWPRPLNTKFGRARSWVGNPTYLLNQMNHPLYFCFLGKVFVL